MNIYQFAFGAVRNLVDVGFVSCTDLSALVSPHPGRYCQTLRVERMDGLRGDAGGDEEGAVAADVIRFGRGSCRDRAYTTVRAEP